MDNHTFPTNYQAIIDRINNIDPIQYSLSRNFIDGQVTYLSPYVSRGVISTKQVSEVIKTKGYSSNQFQKLLQELAWREYFQRVWQWLEDDIYEDIFHRYTGINHTSLPEAIQKSSTGIIAIDNAIKGLYDTGYMHNHLRMYTASITCNIGKAHWQAPSQWMYYHLLDGDLASNTCGWQWIAGTFSPKKYFCNQENINKYTKSFQLNTFIDKSYDELAFMNIPDVLKAKKNISLQTTLPATPIPTIDPTLPILLYNSYNLDPLWRNEMKANRVLLLEPSHFTNFPVSEKVIDFVLELSKNIPGIQLFIGEVNEIPNINNVPAIYSKENPAFKHYPGIKDERDWLFPDVKGFYKSFFSYWKQCEKSIKYDQPKMPHLIRA